MSFAARPSRPPGAKAFGESGYQSNDPAVRPLPVIKPTRQFDIIRNIVPMCHNWQTTQSSSIAPMKTKSVIAALAALAQESRLNAFRLLVQTGTQGLAASKIGEQLDIAPSSLSFHLKELTNAGLIEARQEGRFIIYSANFDTMNSVLSYLTENCCGGESCAPSLKKSCQP